jgi:hypothetical protein
MATVFEIAYKQVEFTRPSATFKIPNLRTRGLLPKKIVFDATAIQGFRDLKEFKIKLGGNDIVKGIDGAFFNLSLEIDLSPYENTLINSTGIQQLILLFRQSIPSHATNPVPGKNPNSIYLNFVIEYKETCGELKSSVTVDSSERFIEELRKIKNPYKITFKPKVPMPQGFGLPLRMSFKDVDNVGYDIASFSSVQTIEKDGAIINWNFDFIPDLIFREQYMELIDPIPQKGVNIYPLDIVVYSAPE